MKLSFIKGLSFGKGYNEVLVLVFVEEFYMEYEVVVSLFYKRGFSLRDVLRNVLLCSLFMIWEEIYFVLFCCF